MAKMIRNGHGFGYTRTDKKWEPEDRNPSNKGTKAYERKQWEEEWAEDISLLTRRLPWCDCQHMSSAPYCECTQEEQDEAMLQSLIMYYHPRNQ